MKNYLYGDGTRSSTQIVLDAFKKMQQPASAAEIFKHVVAEIPDFKAANMFPDLSAMTVNCFSRGNYTGNKKEARQCNTGHSLDQLFKISHKRDARYTWYDVAKHGVWALQHDDKGALRPFCLQSVEDIERAQAVQDIENSNDGWIQQADARRKLMALIVRREGQPAFRKQLLDAYDKKCAVSECQVEMLLEAAHIVPYKGAHTNHASNGILLRADLHKLFDLRMMFIDPDTGKVHLHPSLIGSEYVAFQGKSIFTPIDPICAPSKEALLYQADQCIWDEVD